MKYNIRPGKCNNVTLIDRNLKCPKHKKCIIISTINYTIAGIVTGSLVNCRIILYIPIYNF